MEGDIVCGILAATYGNFLTVTFSTWRKSDLRTWRKEGNGPSAYTSEIDLDPWSWTVAPTLGGAAFEINKKGNARITGIRVVPPSFDVHAYNTMRSEYIKENSEGRDVKKISQEYYRDAHKIEKTDRGRHSEEDKKQARDLRRAKQAEMEARTAEKYKQAFEARKTSDKKDEETKDETIPPGTEMRPSTAPVNFGLLSVVRNTIPFIEKGTGKGGPQRPLSPVKEVKPPLVKAPWVKPTENENPTEKPPSSSPSKGKTEKPTASSPPKNSDRESSEERK